MVEISKSDRDYLLAKGYKWHTHIFASTTRRHYYAVEDPRVLKALDYKRRQEVKGD